MHAAGITCSQRLGDLLATLEPADEATAVTLLEPGGELPLARMEEIIDASGVARGSRRCCRPGCPPPNPRPHLLAGMPLCQAHHRPAHLTRVRDARPPCPAYQARLGVLENWKACPHLLTYRQTERTFGLVADAWPSTHRRPALAGPRRDLRPPAGSQHPQEHKHASAALAVDWTDE